MSLDGVFQQLRLKDEDSARLDPVRRAADNIIREKDAVINRCCSIDLRVVSIFPEFF